MIINPYLVQPSIPAFTGLLDTYSGAAAAYSATRRLSSTYTGFLIRVRRSSDNSEQDIGYTSGNVLDEAALISFVGANNGFVTTWYDQSGNSKNATQSTATLQPKIVSSGSVLLLNGKPNINFASQRLHIGTQIIFQSTSLLTFLGNSSSTGSSTPGFVSYQSSATDNPELRIGTGGSGGSNLYWNGAYVGITTQLLNNKIHSFNFSSGITCNYYVNNSLTSTGTRTGTWNNGVTSFTIGGYSSVGLNKDGDCQEFILWNSNQSSNISGINTNINTFYSLY